MRSRLALAAVVSVLFTLPAWAHHSHGNYVDSFTDITGTVKEVHLLLPHSWIYLEVKDPKGGEPQIWAAKKSLKGLDWNPLESLFPLHRAHFED